MGRRGHESGLERDFPPLKVVGQYHRKRRQLMCGQKTAMLENFGRAQFGFAATVNTMTAK
jgi:hypothetical protein